MGFSSALQGKSAHDALLTRQDAEIRLLEVMKRSLLQKVKCDKEYAIALTTAAQHGLKIDRADDLQGKKKDKRKTFFFIKYYYYYYTTAREKWKKI